MRPLDDLLDECELHSVIIILYNIFSMSRPMSAHAIKPEPNWHIKTDR